jgi:long-chain-fatty-acid--CoA ligase ACSBG
MGSSVETLSRPPTYTESDEFKSTYAGGNYCSTNKKFVANIRVAKKGAASLKPKTVGDVFAEAAKKCGSMPAYRIETPCPPHGAEPRIQAVQDWSSVTYGQYYKDCRKVARAFRDLGLEDLDAVNIYGFNSPQWFMGLFGAILGGGVAAGVYPTDTPEQVFFKARHSGGAIAVVESDKQAKIFLSFADKLPKLKAVVQWSGTVPAGSDKTTSDGRTVKYLSFSDMINDEPKTTEQDLDKLLSAQKPGSVCAYIYTSGTTGNPKAVMISHDNIVYEACTVFNLVNKYAGVGTEQERIISYLPLSHVAGMMVDMVGPLVCAALFGQPIIVHFARPYDLKKGTIRDRLVSVEPTMFLGVPRVWEKIAAALKKKVREAPPPSGVKACIVNSAKAKGLQFQKDRQLGGSGAVPCCYCIATGTVQKKVKEALGLSKMKYAFTGAAPISKETLEFFGVLGININEVYGMSECTGATTVSVDQAHLWGSCGWTMGGTEVKIFKNDDKDGKNVECPKAKDIFNPTDDEQGEICFRGRHIMTGYMANPDLGDDHLKTIQGKLDSAIDKDGWLHSGDKGCMGVNGMVKITGRYKHLLIGAGGENVAPIPIENEVKKQCPAISNCMMIGDKKPFMAAFVTLKAKGATGNEPGGDDLDEEALSVDSSVTKISEAVQSEKYKKYIVDCIIKANKEAAPNNASTIKKICILPRDFSVATNELTPTLKLKRGVVVKMNQAAVDAIYNAPKNMTVVPYPITLSEKDSEPSKEE